MIHYKKAAKRRPARPRPSAGSRRPAPDLPVELEVEPELVVEPELEPVLEPEVPVEVGELTVKVPLVPDEPWPVVAGFVPVPAAEGAAEGTTTRVVLGPAAGTVAASG